MKAARLVADVLVERIVDGVYVPGDLLPSADDLLIEFGVSRPTLREALNQLESAGYVQLRRGPGGGARVREPDQTAVVRALDALLRFEHTSPLHIMEVRLLLEPAAARTAALRATPQELDTLDKNIARQRCPEVLHHPEVWFGVKHEFHSHIAYIGRNPVVRVLADSLRDLVIQANLDAGYTTNERVVSIDQQAGIVERLRAGDACGAEAAMRHHLEQSRLLPDIEDNPPPGVPVRRRLTPAR